MHTDITKKIPGENCGINQEQFPRMGKCCSKNEIVFRVSYEKVCPHCRISTSLPGGASLKTATIFECDLHSYGRRITE